MAVGTGYSKVTTDGLVFAYDTGDVLNSYKGQPTTNLILEPDGNANVITTDVPFGTNVIGYASYDSGYYVNPRNTISTPAAGKTFTYSVYMRSRTSPASTYLMYVYTGTGPDGGWWYFGDGSLTSDWKRYTYTANGLTGNVQIVTVYRYNQLGTIEIAAPQFEEKSYATFFVKGTRSNTQGLLDISGRENTITLVNMTYGANNAISFDGTDDRINTGLSNLGNNITYEAIVNSAGNATTYNMFFGQLLPYIGVYAGNTIIFSDSIGGAQQTIYGGSLSSNINYHVVCTRSYNGSSCTNTIYVNGVQVGQGTFTGAYTGDAIYGNTINVGDGAGFTWYPFYGSMPVGKIYNRPLTVTEIRDNYNHYKTRFNLP